ncbi:MAG: cupredoxin domain-containing protein [Gemmatirosa sp.]|nr:cupredoxin domain-containing protein [Gemmatirosa sp.]
MPILDWLVIAGGLAAVAWVAWYFFLAERPAGVAVATGRGVQEVAVAVRGGYDPATIRVKAGAPVRLLFDRQETSGCSEEVVFPAFGIRRFLPAHARTAIELPAPAAGTYEFTCGMSMLRGRVVAE